MPVADVEMVGPEEALILERHLGVQKPFSWERAAAKEATSRAAVEESMGISSKGAVITYSTATEEAMVWEKSTTTEKSAFARDKPIPSKKSNISAQPTSLRDKQILWEKEHVVNKPAPYQSKPLAWEKSNSPNKPTPYKSKPVTGENPNSSNKPAPYHSKHLAWEKPKSSKKPSFAQERALTPKKAPTPNMSPIRRQVNTQMNRSPLKKGLDIGKQKVSNDEEMQGMDIDSKPEKDHQSSLKKSRWRRHRKYLRSLLRAFFHRLPFPIEYDHGTEVFTWILFGLSVL
ncbi:uncharacterized protein LY89DRAFT_671655 [Mollisia scopiformis]|uniref:Uncharacterized protein n=1 Tax=Mollisia scopiformis TaxID=149040 RepID=A0A194X263_MOLSC|nr:uncharacterized protein LY89DRAFT_671655 [Mollisia scopiformis]KUJ14291.1 hypothetical protein LY89DRAFT_671655 [Mollisia scopiformis]